MNASGDSRKQADGIDNGEVEDDSLLKSKRESLDMQDVLMNSHPWLSVDCHGPTKDTISNNWVDKVMVNKQVMEGRETLPRSWHDDGILYQKQNQMAIRDDSDDMDATTSDSSEPDFIWQPNVHTVTHMPNGAGSKVKRPSPKQAKSLDKRSLIPPPPTRRLSDCHSPLPKG